MFGQTKPIRRPRPQIKLRQFAIRPRGLGQAPAAAPAVSLPTCASVDAYQTIPQAVLVTGGSLALLVGVVGAIFSDTYREQFAITAGIGLASSFAGSVWAAASFNPTPQCTGPGMPSLGYASVNPDQTTPAGQVAPPLPRLSAFQNQLEAAGVAVPPAASVTPPTSQPYATS